MVRIVENTSPEDLLNEMNSKVFRNFLDASIGHTRKTGYETSFEVSRSPSRREFFYDGIIIVGEKDSLVRDGYSERHFRLLNEFQKEHGPAPERPSPNMTDSEKRQAYVKLGEYHKKLNGYLEQKNEQFNLEIDIPFERHFSNTFYDGGVEDLYEILKAHTHPAHLLYGLIPASFVCPSEQDLKSLRSCKRKQIRNGGILNTQTEEEISIPIHSNPLELIISTTKTNRGGHNLGLATCYNPKAQNKEVDEFVERIRNDEANQYSLTRTKKPARFVRDENFAFTRGLYLPTTGEVVFNPHDLEAMMEVEK